MKDKSQMLRKMRINLLASKGWKYLRYAHLRNFIVTHASKIESVCACGSGLGLAELTIAIEFPDLEVLLTDVVAKGRPNYFRSMELVQQWNIRNVRFGVWDLLQPSSQRFDAVVSTEVLEHIRQADVALNRKVEAAKYAVYALVPFATKNDNANAEKRLNAYIKHNHQVCGYDRDFFLKNSSVSASFAGTYWKTAGVPFRQRLSVLTPRDIVAEYDTLIDLADTDLTEREPIKGECMGMKAIIKV